jgi:hypothetical protein
MLASLSFSLYFLAQSDFQYRRNRNHNDFNYVLKLFNIRPLPQKAVTLFNMQFIALAKLFYSFKIKNKKTVPTW